jgi:beta-N-acetylhexosaminidase
MRRYPLFISLLLLLWANFSMALPPQITLKDKIGQMLIFGFKGIALPATDVMAQAILAQQVGGVVLFDYDDQTKTYDRNIKNPAQIKRLTQQLENYADLAAQKHHNQLLPLLIGLDYEGGKVDRLKKSYGFAKTLSAADLGQGSVEQAKQYAQQMARTLKAAGINVNFAPVLDVNVNTESSVINKLQRSFSSDPQKVAQYAAIFSKAYQAYGIACAYKHFPGHGSATGDTHRGFVDVTATWKKYELMPYLQLLAQPYSCPMVMTAHVVHYGLDPKGYPASISAAITTKLLRGELNFTGLVVTDDLQMKAIADNYGLEKAVTMAINAGADMLLFANQLVAIPQYPQQIVAMIYANVMAGKVSEQRIDEAYQRIMQLKKALLKKSSL